MAILNRILNILVLLAAVVALYYSYALYNKRKELRDRGDKLAAAVAEMAKALDKDSGTDLAKSVTAEALSAKNYGKIDGVVGMVKKQIGELGEQRAAMADTLVAIGEGAGVTVPKDGLLSLKDYRDHLAKVPEGLKKAQERSNSLAAGLEEVAEKVDLRLEKDMLKTADTEQVSKAVEDIGKQIGKLKNTNTNLQTGLENIVRGMGKRVNVDVAAIPQARPADIAAIVTALNDMVAKADEVDTIKGEVDKIKEQMQKQIQINESQIANIINLERKLSELEKAKVKAETELADCIRACEGTGTGEKTRITKDFNGHVIDVDYAYNFVIIDLGDDDKLPPKTMLTVARDREFICKIQVSKIYKNYAVAEILPDLKQGSVVKGDRVFYLSAGSGGK